jgi:vancomycin aglycone glucosyltransferase
VHHGGAGTVAAVCRAGIPQAVLPVAWDQPWWAEHLEQMGLDAAADFMALF